MYFPVELDVLDIGVEARRVSIIKTNQKVRKSVQKQMEPFHNDDFNLDPFLRLVILYRKHNQVSVDGEKERSKGLLAKTTVKII